ncbi:hypothetical protein [Actinoplanes sp. NPDC049118]|uniref:hypothetical protein n=1 Tax=Actinoplanes sp. NPDC049118 TaxID=3155769 RepID=UPI0033E33D17
MTVHDLLPRLPSPAVLRERCRSFAVLDATFQSRYPRHVFDHRWAPDGTSLARMDTGGGDLYAIVFAPAGTFLYGFDHESPATPWRDEPRAHWPGLLDGLPESLAHFTREPSFLCEDFFDATVCAWYEKGDSAWRCGPVDFSDPACADTSDPDGAEHVFELLADGSAGAYTEYVSWYFGKETDEEAVAAILAGRPLTPELVAAVNGPADYPAVAAAAAGMGYPVAPA